MSEKILAYALQYGIYILEVVVCALLASRGRWRQHKFLCLYVTLLFVLDGVARPAVLNYFGQGSAQYGYFYWLTDVVLAVGIFLLTCSFFRRACKRDEKLWRFVRVMLFFVPPLVVAITALFLTQHHKDLFANWSHFIVEFSQNLYFSCLVLNTLLYVMIQQFAIDDDELGLLVCGMGVQFAGEAAGLALFNLTSGDGFARVLAPVLIPVCTLGMLLIWIYTLAKTPEAVPVRMGRQAVLAEVISD